MKKDALYYTIEKHQNFTARVLSCEKAEKVPGALQGRTEPLYLVRIVPEGFYPEGGGQASDRGRIGESQVLLVQEDPENPEEGALLHYVDRPLTAEEDYEAALDWEWRLLNSQNHSGEHIVSGLVYQRFGYHNVGFHMDMEGAHPCMTIDFDGEFRQEVLWEIEEAANRIVWENLPIRTFFPDQAALETLPYRSKKRLTGDVRLVEIPGADLCACCGTHVDTTGEIGMIKFLSMVRHRGGVRITLVCGRLALTTLQEIQRSAVEASQHLSVPVEGLLKGIESVERESLEKDQRIRALNDRLFVFLAEKHRGEKLICDFRREFNGVELRRYCDYLMKNTEAAVIVVLSPKEAAGSKPALPGETAEYFYVIGSTSVDLRPGGKQLNQALNGRGGGQAAMLQGTLYGKQEEIVEKVREIFGDYPEG